MSKTQLSYDVNVKAFDFNATTVTVEVVTSNGRHFFDATFGRGAVSVELPKSKLPAFAAYAKTQGVTIG